MTMTAFVGTREELLTFRSQWNIQSSLWVIHSEKDTAGLSGRRVDNVLHAANAPWLGDPDHPLAKALAIVRRHAYRTKSEAARMDNFVYDWSRDSSLSRTYDEYVSHNRSYVKSMVPNKERKTTVPNVLSCMWCAAEFKTNEELEAHEEACA